jgi:hypothetical protein
VAVHGWHIQTPPTHYADLRVVIVGVVGEGVVRVRVRVGLGVSVIVVMMVRE